MGADTVSDVLTAWNTLAEARYLTELRRSEVARALRALSSAYVERRHAVGSGLESAGKRAAFALYYAPLHFLLVAHVVGALGPRFRRPGALFDLGCGTGSSGAAWASACAAVPRITAIDRHPWAVEEARRTYAAFGVRATTRVGDLRRLLPQAYAGTGGGRPARDGVGVLLAFAVNELADAERGLLLDGLLSLADTGARVLVVEPLAGFVAPWWNAWEQDFVRRGGRSDQWRVRPVVPPIVEKLARAAGLDCAEVKGRSLAI